MKQEHAYSLHQNHFPPILSIIFLPVQDQLSQEEIRYLQSRLRKYMLELQFSIYRLLGAKANFYFHGSEHRTQCCYSLAKLLSLINLALRNNKPVISPSNVD